MARRLPFRESGKPSIFHRLAVRTRNAVRQARGALERGTRAVDRAAESAAVHGGGVLVEAGRRLLLVPHRNEAIETPAPLVVGDRRFDVVADLVEYTGLSRDLVLALIRRRPESFRTEWQSFPEALRLDSWFYRASRTYLFGNASHVHGTPQLVHALADTARGGCVLEFGGGSANLALALGALGLRVDYLEVSALQKDFARYRIWKHGLQDTVAVLDSWEELPRAEYDLVVALDVFEHIPDLGRVLEESVLPALRPGGRLVEESPFVKGVSNPMHHEDEIGFESFLAARGLRVVRDEADFRVWAAQ